MKTFVIQIIALLLVAFTALTLSFNPDLLNKILPKPNRTTGVSDTQTSGLQSETIKVRIIDATSTNDLVIVKAELNVEVSDEKGERAAGLSNRQSLASDSGMLFVFDKTDTHKFWMKGLKFPLDFIWINGDRIVDLLPNVPNPSPGTPDNQLPIYAPITKVDKVLEVNAGFINTYNIRVGDKLQQLR